MWINSLHHELFVGSKKIDDGRGSAIRPHILIPCSIHDYLCLDSPHPMQYYIQLQGVRYIATGTTTEVCLASDLAQSILCKAGNPRGNLRSPQKQHNPTECHGPQSHRAGALWTPTRTEWTVAPLAVRKATTLSSVFFLGCWCGLPPILTSSSTHPVGAPPQHTTTILGPLGFKHCNQ